MGCPATEIAIFTPDSSISLGDMQAKLLAKIEELTLHMIEAEKENGRLGQENRTMQERIERLEKLSDAGRE